MATRLRLSNLLRRSVVKAFANSTQHPATSLPSSHVMCRSMAFTKLFMGGLALTTHEQTLRNEFAKFGDVVDVRIITHPDSGKSKGFGFVTMADENQADTAIAGMDGKGSSVQGSFSEAGLGWNSSPKGSFGDQSGFGGTIQSGFTQGIFKDDIQDSSRVGSGQQEQNSSEFPHRMPNVSATSQSGSLPLNPSVKTPHDASWEDFLNGIEFGSGQGDSSQGSKRDTENSSLELEAMAINAEFDAGLEEFNNKEVASTDEEEIEADIYKGLWISHAISTLVFFCWNYVGVKRYYCENTACKHSPRLVKKPLLASSRHWWRIRRKMPILIYTKYLPYLLPKEPPWPAPQLYNAPGVPVLQVLDQNLFTSHKFGVYFNDTT